MSLVPANGDVRFNLDGFLRPFVSQASPDLMLRVHYGPEPYSEFGHLLFDSGGNWTIHRVQGKLIIHLHARELGTYQLAVLQPDLRHGDIYCVGELWSDPDRRPSLLGYPMGEVLFINLLAQERGVLLHALGIIQNGRGTVFAGTSGAGKSTLARLWAGQEGVTLLSDDRVIVRRRDGRFWAYGTPWHGDARVASPEAVPLERIFVIQHASANQATPLRSFDAAARLLVCSFPTFWDAEGMAFTLEFLDQLSQAVPCHELGFVPDSSIVDFVRCLTSV